MLCHLVNYKLLSSQKAITYQTCGGRSDSLQFPSARKLLRKKLGFFLFLLSHFHISFLILNLNFEFGDLRLEKKSLFFLSRVALENTLIY